MKHVNVNQYEQDVENEIKRHYVDVQAKSPSFFYFHATNWSGAVSICDEGVFHDVGRFCTDFGIKPCFYTGPNSKDAIEWASKKSRLFNREAAILVFSFPNSPLKHSNLQVKSFEKANREWSRLVRESRACLKKRGELDAFDLVHGPMVANIDTIAPHKPFKWQLASKSVESDAYFDHHLIGVVWLKK